MATDIQLNDTNINSYYDIPYSGYPTLAGVTTEVSVFDTTRPASSILPNGDNVCVQWKYPLPDNLTYRLAVGYQLQVLEGTFTAAECNTATAPGPIVYEEIANLNTAMLPENRYVWLQQNAVGKATLSTNTLKSGIKYTVRVRALLFSEKGEGTVSDQYFKYSEYGVCNASVDNLPSAVNLRVNNLTNPSNLPSTAQVIFSFTFVDVDGPKYLYKVEVGTNSEGFTANVWDSGLINVANGTISSQEFVVPYSGTPLTEGVTYYWRVTVSDGTYTSDPTSLASFKSNIPPNVQFLKVNGTDILSDSAVIVDSADIELAWLIDDSDRPSSYDALPALNQTAYSLRVECLDTSSTFAGIDTGDVASDSLSYTISSLPEGATFKVSLRLRDDVEFGEFVSGTFTVNAKPQVSSLTVNGMESPVAVSPSSVTFAWIFADTSSGQTQQKFMAEVATDSEFANLTWATTEVTSSVSSVAYGASNDSGRVPVVVQLTHNSYFFRVKVFDGVSWSDWATTFFSMNARPASPTLLTPTAGSYGATGSTLTVTWLPDVVPDPNGDDVTYTLEITPRRSSNRGWEYLAGPLSPTPVARPEYVFVVLVDGVKYTDFNMTNTPGILGLAATGVSLTNFFTDVPADSGYETVTMAGHAAIMTGYYDIGIDNSGAQSPSRPSYMQEWMYNKQQVSTGTTTKAKFIGGKQKLWALRQCTMSGPWNTSKAYFNCGTNGVGGGGDRNDANTQTTFLSECLGTTVPNLCFLSFRDTDSYAHANNVAAYITALQMVDGYVSSLWAEIQARPDTQNKSVLIVTTDHGRSSVDFTQHGGRSTSERQVAFFAFGPMIKQATVSTLYGLSDIAPTIMYLLGMQKVESTGQVMTDIIDYTPTSETYELDISEIKSGADYGIRVVSNDGYCESDPESGGASPAFTIVNHAPTTPTFVTPTSETVATSVLGVEWVEATPPDIDGDAVVYSLDVTRDATASVPTYENLKVFSEGTSKAYIDISAFPDGENYMLRLTAYDDKGGKGAEVFSEQFAILNTPNAADFAKVGTSTFVSTTDGRIMRTKETIWEMEDNFTNTDNTQLTSVSTGQPEAYVQSGKLVIKSTQADNFLVRITKDSNG
jgi:hypothetical protein